MTIIGGLAMMGGTLAVFDKYRDPVSAYALISESALFILAILAVGDIVN
jgi:hypothetical protein